MVEGKLILPNQLPPSKLQYPPDYYASSKALLETALGKIPMYRSWKARDPGPQASVDDRYARMPALTKLDIVVNFPGGVLPPEVDLSAALVKGEVQLIETSGTTGDKITNIWNQRWWDASEKSSWKLNTHLARIATGDHNEAILVNPRNVGIVSDEVPLLMEDRRLARFLYLNEKTDPTAWTAEHMDRMIREIGIFQPPLIEANPSYLARLCRYASASGKTVFQPGAIVFTYEYPTRMAIAQIRRVFPAVPFTSSYGTTETGYVFLQCEAGRFHQNSDFCRVDFEPFKATHGGPALGRILVTPLHNPWSYLIHFETGDIVKLETGGRCPCGRESGLVLEAIAGRRANLTLTCEGRLVTLLELDTCLNHLPEVSMYQMVQLNQRSYELHLVSRVTDREKLRDKATSLLKALYGREAGIEVIYDTDIAPESTGKYLISKCLFPIDLDTCLDRQNVKGGCH